MGLRSGGWGNRVISGIVGEVAVSTVVPVSGTFAERRRIQEDVAEGLHSLGSREGTRFFMNTVHYPPWDESDIIVVPGKLKLVQKRPEEPEKIYRNQYLSPDFLVVLEKPDTQLYLLRDFLPSYRAEAGTVKGFQVLAAVAFGLVVSSMLAVGYGFGWWSFLYALATAIMIVMYFAHEYRLKAWFIGMWGALFIRRQVSLGRKSLEEYWTLVDHLSRSDEPDVAIVNRMILKFI